MEKAASASLIIAPLAIAILAVGFQQAWPLLLPPQTPGPDAILMLFMMWGMLIYCCFLVTDAMVLFVLVPGLAVLGLSATIDINTPVFVYFMGFLFSGIFLMFWENALHGITVLVRSSKQGEARKRAVNTLLLISLASFAITLALAFPIMLLLQAMLPRVNLLSLAQQNAPGFYNFSSSFAGFYDNAWVGTGPVGQSDTPVMKVRCDEPLLWRGKIYNEFTGQMWRVHRDFFLRTAIYNKEMTSLTSEELGIVAPAKATRHTQWIEPQIQLPSLLFAANRPVEAGFHSRRYDKLSVRISMEGMVQLVFMPPVGNAFEVISAVPDEEAAKPYKGIKASDGYERMWLQLPPSSQVLKPLAQQVAAGGKTRYEKIKLLQEYLEKNFLYNLRARATPYGQDAAVFFLTDSKQGVCDAFATSLVVLARNLEIPARFVTGFATGDAQEDGTFLVREKHAHAWAEVHFPGVGWVTFDPSALEEVDNPLPFASLEELMTKLRKIGVLVRQNLIFLSLCVVGLFLIYSTLLHAMGDKGQANGPEMRELATRPEKQVINSYSRALGQLRELGLQRQASEGAQEFASRAAMRLRYLPGDLLDPFEQLTRLYNQARFGPHTVGEAEVESAAQLAARLMKGVPADERKISKRPPRPS